MVSHLEAQDRLAVLQKRRALYPQDSEDEDNTSSDDGTAQSTFAGDATGRERTDTVLSSTVAALEERETAGVSTAAVSHQEVLHRMAILRGRRQLYPEDSSENEDEESVHLSPSRAQASTGAERGGVSDIGWGASVTDKTSNGRELSDEEGVSEAEMELTLDTGHARGSRAGAGWREMPQGKWEGMTLEHVRAEGSKFAVARDWTQFHTPRNIMSALTSELTEALGLWREVGFGGKGLSAQEKHHVGEEISDCLVYLLRLADVMDVDLPRAVQSKLEKNAAKYPAELVYGSSKKYTHYQSHKDG